MKAGTPGFVAARLIEGREARGMSQTDLAQVVGVKRQAVSQYESGESSPHPLVMEKIRARLALPLDFFLRPAPPESAAAIFFRSNKGEVKREKKKAGRRHGWLRSIAGHVSEWVEFPATNLPEIELPRDVFRISRDDIDRAAQSCRLHWKLGVGPIANVTALLEAAGVVVARDALDADGLDALSQWPDDDPRPCFLLGEDKASAVRSRFDAAHELGHMLLHRGMSRESVESDEHFALIERQCHYFAGTFLLPERSFLDDVFAPTLDAFCSIKSKWGVSIAAMIRRARNVQLIDETAYTKLNIALSRRGWRKGEPLDDELPVEKPRLLADAIDLVIREGGVTRGDLVNALALMRDDIESLAGLAPGYLNDTPAPVVTLKPRDTTTIASRPQAAPAAIIPIRSWNDPKK